MANKKIIFVITNPTQFKGFFRDKLRIIKKEFEIYLLIYPYGFSRESNIEKEIKVWTNKLKKKLVVKKIWYLKEYSIFNIRDNIYSNIHFIKTLNEIRKCNIDVFFVPAVRHYWEKITLKYFSKKIFFGYLLSPPSGLDLFNSLNDFNNSILKKRLIFNKGKFNVKSDNDFFHYINTNTKISKYRIPILGSVIEKIKIKINILINIIIIPIYLNCFKIHEQNIFDRVNFNFVGIDKIICFHPILYNLTKKSYPKKRIYNCNLFNENFNKSKKISRQWIFLHNDTYFKSLDAFFKILVKLKKLKKINEIHIKKHPTWQSNELDLNFKKKLKKIQIPYKILKNSSNIIYEKYFGIISEPTSAFIEGLMHNKDIKILGTFKNIQSTSRANFLFYRQMKEICWNPNIKNLKDYLIKENDFKYKKYIQFKRKDLGL